MSQIRPITRARRRRRSDGRFGWIVLALFLASGALLYRVLPMLPQSTRPELTLAAETAAAMPVRSALERNPGRPVYPYSVIRGGAYSTAELESALRQDSVASAHYAGFRRESVRLMRAPASTLMYASYRIGNNVYWTSHRIHIASGEALIADGTSLARARCGNRLSDSPREPVARMEPMEREMDSPESIEPTALSPGDLSPADRAGLDRLLALHPPTAPSSALAFELFPLVEPSALSARETSQPDKFVPSMPVPSMPIPSMTFRGSIFGIWEVALPLVPGSRKNPPQPTTTSQPPTATDEFPPFEPEPAVGNPSVSPLGSHDVPEPVAAFLCFAGLVFLWIAAKRLRRRHIA